MKAPRFAIILWVSTLCAAAGCACTCPPPGGYAVSPPPPASYPATTSSSSRERGSYTSFYDRYREERHRREVEKELRDIKRNTKRGPQKLR